MRLSLKANMVAIMWKEIVSVSRTERREKQKKKTVETIQMPTLEKLETYLDGIDWEFMPFDRHQAIEWIFEFHRSYIGGLLSA